MSALLELIPTAAALLPTGEGLPRELQTKLDTIVGWVTTIAISLCIIGVIITGAMMAIAARRGDGGEHASRLGWVLAGCILIGAASGVVNALVG